MKTPVLLVALPLVLGAALARSSTPPSAGPPRPPDPAPPPLLPDRERAPAIPHTFIHVEIAHVGLDRYVLDADEIVRGTVTGERQVFPEEGLAYTEYDLAVLEACKGSPGETIRVRVAGARSRERVVELIGAPRFEEGEQVVLFLAVYPDPRTGELYRGIVGLSEGTLRATSTSPGTARAVGTHARDGETLSEFGARVRALVAAASRTGGKEQRR